MAGDQDAALIGRLFPHALRPTGTGYHCLDIAYIDELEHGKHFQSAAGAGAQLEQFVLI